ncbi:MAG: hypothetical protein IT376_23295 [Polyangiaceae bacterium]|nr:hypothetical protein [Polyangiaceae bacterium]
MRAVRSRARASGPPGRAWRWGAAGLLVAGCGGEVAHRSSERAPAAPPATAPRADASAATPAPERSPADRASAAVEAALGRLAGLRGLAAREPVRVRAVTRAELLAIVQRAVREDVPADVVRAQQELLVALGVVPSDFDLVRALLELLGSELAGLYEPKERTMYLADDLSERDAHATLSHELVHALQDQHFGLGDRVRYRAGEGDRIAAVHALAEGDATSAMIDDSLGRPATELPDETLRLQVGGALELGGASERVPRILRRSLLAPYIEGTIFVHWARRTGGWAAVDAAWSRPPESTEQLLHPARYLAKDAPVPVPAPPPPAGMVALGAADVMGELSLRLVLDEWMPARAASDAAEGWAGDTTVTFTQGARVAVAWRIRMETPRDAQELLVGLARGVLRQRASAQDVDLGEAERRTQGGSACELHETGPMAVARAGLGVVLVSGPYVRAAHQVSGGGSCAEALVWAKASVRQR